MQILKGHLSIKPVRSLAFSPDGKQLASSARDYRTFLWDLSAGTFQPIEERDSYTVAFSPDGKVVATGRTGDVILWDSTTGEKRQLKIEYEPADGWGSGWHVAFAPDGKCFAAVAGGVRLYDARTLKRLPLSGDVGHATSCVAISPDGATLATGNDTTRKVVRLWDVRARQFMKDLVGATATIDNVSFSPDGKHLAAASGTTLWVWDVASGEPVVRHVIGKQRCKDVAFSPDGRLLGFASNDASIRFLSTTGWGEVEAYDFKIGPMISFAFAPDGMRAAGGSGKGKIVVFDVDL